MGFSLGTIDPLNVQAWQGFDYPEQATITAILGDGSSGGNAVLQSSALTLRRAAISGILTSSGDRDALRTASESKDATSFSDDEGGSRDVYVFDLQITRVFPGVWSYRATLVEAG